MLLAVLCIFAAYPAYSQTPPSALPPGATEIHLSQQAERMVQPDRLRVELRIDSTGRDRRKVQGDVNKRMADALDHVRGNASITSATGAYQVYRDFNQNGPGDRHASQTISLTSSDFASVQEFAGDLQNAGLVIDSTAFFLAPETLKAAQDQLTAEALAGLRDRATTVAGDMGMRVANFREIEIGNAGQGGGPPVMRAMAMASPASAPVAPPSFQPGPATMSLTVTADVILAARTP